MKPVLIRGGRHKDERGNIRYNNEFNAKEVKRIYTIENASTDFIRGWQGHAVEKRWFSVIQGKFEIRLIQIENWEEPDKNAVVYTYILNADQLDVLFVPNGYVSSIQAMQDNSKLLAMSDYILGEIQDEYRFDKSYFKS